MFSLACPVASDQALWEVEIAQAWALQFVISAKALALLLSSLNARRVERRLNSIHSRATEQAAARRVGRYVRRFLSHRSVQRLRSVPRLASGACKLRAAD